MTSPSAAGHSGIADTQELQSLLDSLHSSAALMPCVQELDDVLESILSELTEKLHFEFVAISLVDEYRNCIETVRGRNISPGWIMRAKHDLDDPDIQTHIVKTSETKTVIGWDDLLDKDIYDRFEHWRLARVFAPILSPDQRVVGTIEAGCNKERKDEVLTEFAIERVKQLGCEKGDAIARKRPHILLQGIAKNAIQLIGADSATLHVYKHKTAESSVREGDEWGEPILATGAGEATPEFVKSYKPGPGGRGRKATQTGEPDWVDDPTQFQTDYPKLYELGIRALAVIPLKLGPDTAAILGIHFWRTGKQFTPRELNLAERFARAMEGVIQNYLLLKRATEAGSRAWALSGLENLMQSLTSPFSLPDVLRQVAKNALLTLDADNVAVYQYHADRKKFYLPPVVDGQVMSHPSMTVDLRPDDELFEFIDHGASQFFVDSHESLVLTAPNETGNPRFIDRERVKSCAVLVLRSGEGGEIVGLLFVNFRQAHNFSGEEKRAMDALATSAALAIRNARLHKGDLNRQLEAMNDVHAAIAEKGPDLKQVLERLLQQALKMTAGKYGAFMLWDDLIKVLKPGARWPVRGDYPIEPQVLGEGIIGLAAESGKSILVEDVGDENKHMFVETVGDFFPAKFYKKINPDTRCEIAVPLLDEGRLLGVLNIEHPEAGFFTQDDRVLLQTLAVPAIIALHTVDLYKMLERRILHRKALNLVAARVQEKPYELDTILRLFLTGITAGDGLGFSRAMLFLADEGGRTLRGHSALGAVTRLEAEKVWQDLKQSDPVLASDLNSLLRQAEQFSEDIREGRVVDYPPLSSKLREIRIDIEKTPGALARCLERRKSETVDFDEADPLRETIRGLTEPDDLRHAFACAPLIGKQKKPIGVLVVDNRFLLKERKIDDEEIAGLEAFAGLLALSIENVRLQERLAEQQRVENWKEVTGSIAHSVGTLLFEAKGDVRNLRGHLCAPTNITSEEKLGALFDELNNGISRAEKVLFEFRSYANPTPLELEQLDLRRILRNVFQPVHGGCPIEMSLPSPLPVLADASKLGNSLREIRKNALEAMAGIADRPALIEVKVRVDEDTLTKRFVRIEITDNGDGIKDSVIRDVFKPGKTTKADGTGLGLPMVKSVIEAHGGTIEADNGPDGGARFTVRIPMMIVAEEERTQRSG